MRHPWRNCGQHRLAHFQIFPELRRAAVPDAPEIADFALLKRRPGGTAGHVAVCQREVGAIQIVERDEQNIASVQSAAPIVRMDSTSPAFNAGPAAMESVTAVCRACSPSISATCGSIRDAHSQQVDPSATASSAITAITIFPSRPTILARRREAAARWERCRREGRTVCPRRFHQALRTSPHQPHRLAISGG